MARQHVCRRPGSNVRVRQCVRPVHGDKLAKQRTVPTPRPCGGPGRTLPPSTAIGKRRRRARDRWVYFVPAFDAATDATRSKSFLLL